MCKFKPKNPRNTIFKKWLLEEQRFRDKNVTKKTIITTAKQIQKVTEHSPNTKFIISVARSTWHQVAKKFRFVN